MVGYIPKWFTCSQRVTYLSINLAQCKTTLLIGHNWYAMPPTQLLTYLTLKFEVNTAV